MNATQERPVKIAEIYVTQRAKRSRNTITKHYQASGETESEALSALIQQLDFNAKGCTFFRKESDTFCFYDGRKLGELLLAPSQPFKLASYEAINFHDAFHKYKSIQ